MNLTSCERAARSHLVLANAPRSARLRRISISTTGLLVLAFAALTTPAAAQALRADHAALESEERSVVAPTWDGAWLAATLRDAAQHADHVLAGEVVRIEAFPSGPQGQRGIHTRVTLRTDPTLLGASDDDAPLETSREEIDFWMPGGRLGNRIRLLTGQVRFELGETVAVLVYATDHGTLWPASLARSKWRFDGDRLSLPSARGSLSLDRFRALVGALHRSGP